MKSEIQELARRYGDGTLSDTERARLKELLARPEAREEALRSEAPEVVFLATDETIAEKAQDARWDQFRARLLQQTRRRERRNTNGRLVAAAAAIIAVVILGLYWVNTLNDVPSQPMSADAGGLINKEFKLEHRQIPQVLNELNTVLSADKKLKTDFSNNSISITDRPENIEAAGRMLTFLDQPPITLSAQLGFWLVEDEMALQRQQVSRDGTEFDSRGFSAGEQLHFKPATGDRFQQTIDGRWRVTCLIGGSGDGTALTIRNLLVYDMLNDTVVVRAEETQIIPGNTALLSKRAVVLDGQPVILTLKLEETGN